MMLDPVLVQFAKEMAFAVDGVEPSEEWKAIFKPNAHVEERWTLYTKEEQEEWLVAAMRLFSRYIITPKDESCFGISSPDSSSQP